MHKQIHLQRTKSAAKKSIIKKQITPVPQAKKQEKSHIDKFVLEPIITVNGERKVKKYEKIKIIGRGSYSQCFLVKTVGTQSMYALKIIPKSKLEVLILEKLIYEIKIQQLLSHPHVVYLDHWFEDEQFQYIFMEYCPNGTLQSKLREMTQFSQKNIKKYVRQIIESLMYIHSKNILHRDLKMCNFYIDENDNVKLGDFGFACQLNHPNQLKRQTCGTPNYIAPQSISGFGYSFTADVWAVGVILYRMKYAICPFQGTTVKYTLQNVKLCRYVFPKTPKISIELKDLITKIFNLNYDERLNLQQIYNHPFFEDSTNQFSQNKNQGLAKQKRGFSLTRLFSSSKKQVRQKQKDPPKNSSKAPVRSNSCETFKKIKQTFKQKNLNTLVSNNTMPTQQNSLFQMKTQAYITLGPLTTGRESSSHNKSVRDIVDSYNSANFLSDLSGNSKAERNSRLNQFLAKQQVQNKTSVLNIKQKSKVDPGSAKLNKQEGDKKRLYEQMLCNFLKKYYFPIGYKNEKDIIIASFPQGIKMLICPSQKGSGIFDQQKNLQTKTSVTAQVLILYKNKFQVYDLQGQKVEPQSISKVVKYIIDKKIINFEEGLIESENFFNANQSLQNVLNKLPSIILHKKQGIVMVYGTRIKGYFVAKSSTQELSYLASLQEKKLNTLFKYNPQRQNYEVEQGPILSRIYLGWTQQLLSLYNQK